MTIQGYDELPIPMQHAYTLTKETASIHMDDRLVTYSELGDEYAEEWWHRIETRVKENMRVLDKGYASAGWDDLRGSLSQIAAADNALDLWHWLKFFSLSGTGD